MSSNQLTRRYIILISLSLLLMLLDHNNLLSFPKKLTQTITLPIESAMYHLYQSATNTFGFISFWHNGYQEINYLRQRNAELTVDAALTDKLKQENEILKNQFNTNSVNSVNLLPAKIIGYDRYLVINKGRKDHVAKGQIVVLKNILVGMVYKVEDKTSLIQIPTDPQSKIAVITTSNRAKGILTGYFGSEMVLEEVVQAEKVDLEEPIEAFFGDESNFNLIIGKVTKTLSSQSTIFQRFSVKPLLDFGKLTTVFIKIN